ncbi:dihydrolipoamide dehydrogenase [Arthrobacter sp. V1I7]|uniref:dihydrolipoyl dehydrogenase n=1 Tax=Arthrobacter sp. V1I7 TaxID=3042274 RepID=UPI00278B9C3A|nr:dihydrolipoyl dehydrogenase [Arthrobacter sp. V1I7]MDQ0823771.1 dihydrolipoamide dehydrogenase [Arthrobacter sp. V1I7]
MVVGEMAESIDVLVIGGGPGGYSAAARAAELGKDVTLVEQGNLGGVCLNTGCIPSKVFTTAARDLVRSNTLAYLSGSDLSIDLPALQTQRTEIVAQLAGGVRSMLSKVRVVTGTARFLDRNRVVIESGAHASYLRFEHAVIATGSAPATLDFLTVDNERVLDSTGVLALQKVPESLCIVGGDYPGMELAMAFARFGSRVTIIESSDSILAGFDRDLAQLVIAKGRSLGIDVRLSTRATGMEDGDLLVASNGTSDRVLAEKFLVNVGRVPLTDDLQLDLLDVRVSETGHIEVDEQNRSSVPHVFAVGDVTAGLPFAHRALAEGRVAAEVLAGRPSAADSRTALIAFTDPEVASVGLTEAEAKRQGRSIRVGRSRFSSNGRAVILGEETGLVKVVVDPQTDIILGVHLAGPGATDLIAGAALAVETASRLEDVLATMHPHPTLSEGLHSAMAAAHRRSADGRGSAGR